MTGECGDLWVFGYGSLMWRPGFAFEERRLATLFGYHRGLCIFSHVHRGTPHAPGLVLGRNPHTWLGSASAAARLGPS